MTDQSALERKRDVLEQTVRELEQSYFIERRWGMYRDIVSTVERPLIETALERTYGNQIKAAKILGLNRNTLRAKIRKLGIRVDKWKVLL